jgi:hypothetical protein
VGVQVFRIGDNSEIDPDQWAWYTLRVFDRTLGPQSTIPIPRQTVILTSPRKADYDEKKRSREYQNFRFNMPVGEVLPSLMPGQTYEVRV